MAETTVVGGGAGFFGHVQQMLNAYPGKAAKAEDKAVLDCIQACLDCAQACTACADACIAEENPKPLARCIRLDLDCANVCEVTARVFSRQTARDAGISRSLLQACAVACRACGDECERHGKTMKHCAVCAEACRACEKACDRLIAAA